MTKGYLTEQQAAAIISGGANADLTHTRTDVQVQGSHLNAETTWFIHVKDGDFEGFLSSTRAPDRARGFKTLDAAHRAAHNLLRSVLTGADIDDRFWLIPVGCSY